jgi:hypothetical protein
MFPCYNVAEENDSIEMTRKIRAYLIKNYFAVRRKLNFSDRALRVGNKHVLRKNKNATYLNLMFVDPCIIV